MSTNLQITLQHISLLAVTGKMHEDCAQKNYQRCSVLRFLAQLFVFKFKFKFKFKFNLKLPESGSAIRPPSCVTVDQTRASLSMLLGSCHDDRPMTPFVVTSLSVLCNRPEVPLDSWPGNRRCVLIMLSRARCSDTLLFGLSEGLAFATAVFVKSGATINSGTAKINQDGIYKIKNNVIHWQNKYFLWITSTLTEQAVESILDNLFHCWSNSKIVKQIRAFTFCRDGRGQTKMESPLQLFAAWVDCSCLNFIMKIVKCIIYFLRTFIQYSVQNRSEIPSDFVMLIGKLQRQRHFYTNLISMWLCSLHVDILVKRYKKVIGEKLFSTGMVS